MALTKAERSNKCYYKNHEVNKKRARDYQNKRYAEGKVTSEKVNEYYKARKRRDPVRVLYWSVKTRARKKGREFDMSLEFFKEMFKPMRCTITGIKLKFAEEGAKHDPIMPTIDRIDNDRGYVEDNVRLVSWAYNRAKSNLTDEELEKILLCPWAKQQGLI